MISHRMMYYLFSFKLCSSSAKLVNNLIKIHNYRFYCTNYKQTNLHPLLKCQISSYSTTTNNEEFSSNNDNVTTLLLNYGFKYEDLSNLIEKYPEITKLPEDRLNSTLNSWYQLGEKHMILLLLKHPGLIFIKRSDVQNFLHYFFNKYDKEDIIQLLLNAPKSVLSNVDLIEEKMNYLEKVMTITKKQIINTDTLELTLHKIKERHEFLKRIGIYKAIDDKKDVYFKNPRLDKIMSTSDEEFATKVAGVTLFEYEVFQQLFEEEEMDE